MGSFMHLHEKIGLIRTLKGLTQEEMAEKLNMSITGYAKIERGETQLHINRLEKIVAALEMELKDLFSFDEKMVFNASLFFNSSFHDQCFQDYRNYVNSAKEIIRELETSKLIIEQKDREISLLNEQIDQLKRIIELMKKIEN